MKTHWRIIRWLELLALATINLRSSTVHAQGTAFTYQGQLNDSGNPANGSYDLRFTIYDAVTGGNAVGIALTNPATVVSNGLFAVGLDFGSGIFTGPARWLDIGVRTNGSTNAFIVLSPRQMLTPVPYAIFANTASNLSGGLSATQLSGTLPASALTGYTDTVALTNGGNLFSGTWTGGTLSNVAIVNPNATQGHNYIIVAEGTNDVNHGNNLLAAYATATTLNPSVTNRVTVIVPPGNYNLGTTGLVMNTSYVDLIGLVPAQQTMKRVVTNSAGRISTKTVANVQYTTYIYNNATCATIQQTVDNVHIESLTLSNAYSGAVAYYPTVAGTNTVLKHVAMSSMQGSIEYAGLYVDCVSGDYGFGGRTSPTESIASGTFIDCVAGQLSFAGYSIASGTFINCTAGSSSFGASLVASGIFINCVGEGSFSPAGNGGGISGTFIGCVGGYGSFGGIDTGYLSGTFIDCVGGDVSFGGGPYSSVSGTFINCVGGTNSFGGGTGTLASSAKLSHCKAGSGSFGSFLMASDDFNYNVGGSHTFLMLPNLPTSTNNLPTGSVWNNNGTLMVK